MPAVSTANQPAAPSIQARVMRRRTRARARNSSATRWAQIAHLLPPDGKSLFFGLHLGPLLGDLPDDGTGQQLLIEAVRDHLLLADGMHESAARRSLPPSRASTYRRVRKAAARAPTAALPIRAALSVQSCGSRWKTKFLNNMMTPAPKEGAIIGSTGENTE